MGKGDIEFLAQILIDRINEKLKETVEDENASELEKALAEMTLYRDIIDHKSFLIGKKAFEKEENAFLIRDYFKLVIAGLESFEESLEKEK